MEVSELPMDSSGTPSEEKLQAEIFKILKKTPNIRAAQIADELSKNGYPATQDTVIKLLCHGHSFNSSRSGNSTVWYASPAPKLPGCANFEIEDVGQFSIFEEETSEEKLRDLLRIFARATPQRAVWHDNTVSGQVVARIALELGFTAEPRL